MPFLANALQVRDAPMTLRLQVKQCAKRAYARGVPSGISMDAANVSPVEPVNFKFFVGIVVYVFACTSMCDVCLFCNKFGAILAPSKD